MLGELFGMAVEEMLGQSTRIWYPSEEDFVKGGGAVYEQFAGSNPFGAAAPNAGERGGRHHQRNHHRPGELTG